MWRKVGATVLSRVMQRLPETHRDDVLIGRDAPDDCAMLSVPQGKVMVQSVDYFRAFIEDSYKFGAIAANHALGDIFAMGAEPQSALAIATVPYGRERVVEETLYDVLAGALHTLEPTGAVLAVTAGADKCTQCGGADIDDGRGLDSGENGSGGQRQFHDA